MSAGAKQRLMSEFKALEKEKWLNIEACGSPLPSFLDQYANDNNSSTMVLSSNGTLA